MSEYNPHQKDEIVLTAAIYIDDKQEHIHQPTNIKTGYVVTGHRHHNCFMTLKILGVDRIEMIRLHGKMVQGFITSKHNFLDRDEAGALAFRTGQQDKIVHLFSEDLY